MIEKSSFAVVRNIKILCTFESAQYHDNMAIEKAGKILKKAGLFSHLCENSLFVYKKSVDARNKNEIYFVYSIAGKLKENFSGKISFKGVELVERQEPQFECKRKIKSRPVVVGFGPSGMFCALALSRAGLNPIIIERGQSVEDRAQSVREYWEKGKLNEESNVQFGEGGAGTFSDGKLLTRISDKLCYFVIDTFVNCGAPQEIRYLAKPHIGTDYLKQVVKNLREQIKALGGEFLFNTKVSEIEFDGDGKVKSVTTQNGKIETDAVFLCIGHSARDTVKMLCAKDVKVEAKPFSVGVRIEHLQKDIDNSLYGKFKDSKALERGQYTLSRIYGDRAVYSFCMCPGGQVVASASENGQIVTNGMSEFARDGKNANSAIAVSVNLNDFGGTVEGAIDFQENLEKRAFMSAGCDNTAPIQLFCDFKNDTLKSEPSRIMPTYTGNTKLTKASEVFPKFICENITRGICDFERDISGFSCDDAVLTFPETRTSSPVKIPRDENFEAEGKKGLYPCGEGAGYAGGITSAAVDGLKCALSYLNKTEE